VEAISHLFKEHNRTLVLYLAARLRDEQLAKEVAQEAYVKLLQLERPGAVSFLRSYLFRVASNLAIDRLRQQDSRTRIDQKDAFDDFIEDCMGERAAEAQDELAYVKRCLYELPPRYGQAFHLHALLELSFDEIAEAMCIKPRMVRHYVTLSLVYVRLRREGVARDEAWKRIHRE
jgi:RNA polymerase sigma-70 factor (ECF subfamily)